MWPTDMSGNYGTGIDPSLLQILLPYLGGLDLKDQKSVLDVQQKQQSNVQDLLRILFDPQFAMLTGTYDPNVLVQQEQAQQQAQPMPTPKLSAAAASGDPRVSFVAQGILSGEIADKFVAQKMLIEAIEDPTSAVAGMTPEMIAAEVGDWFSEKADSEIQTFKAANKINDGTRTSGGGAEVSDDPYSKAGLPQPTEQYMMSRAEDGSVTTNSPIEAGTRAQLDRTQQLWQRDAQALKEFIARNPGYRTPLERTRTDNDIATLEQGGLQQAQNTAARLKDSLTSAEVTELARRFGENDLTRGVLMNLARSSGGNVKIADVEARLKGLTPGTYDVNAPRHREFRSFLQEKRAAAKTATEWSGRGLVEAKRQAGTGVDSNVTTQGDAAYRQARKSEKANSMAFAQGVGQTAALNAKGRTPLTDALQQRLAMYRAVGLL